MMDIDFLAGYVFGFVAAKWIVPWIMSRVER